MVARGYRRMTLQTVGVLSPAAKAGGHCAGQLKASKLAVDTADGCGL